MPETYKYLQGNTTVKRGSDGASIPNNTANKDWQDYLAWVSGGGLTGTADALPTATEVLADDRMGAVDVFLNSPGPIPKALRGEALVTMDELNNIRQWLVAFKAAIAGAGVTSIATLKTAVAALPNMPDRNASQIKTAVENKINVEN